MYIDSKFVKRIKEQHGFSLVYIVGALVALGAVATAVTSLTPSSTLTELNQNMFGQAYYAAYSGLQFLKYGENGVYDDVEKFVTAVNTGLPYAVTTKERFDLSLSYDTSNPNDNKYTVNYLIGTYSSNGVEKTDSFVLAKNVQRSFTKKTSSKPENLLDKTYSSDVGYILTNDTYTTNSVASSRLALNDRAYVDMNVVSSSSVILGNDSKVGGYVCAGTSVQLNDRASVAGSVYAVGDVTLSNDSDVYGQIVTKGSLSFNDRAHAVGDVYVGGSIRFNNDSVLDNSGHVINDVTVNERVRVGKKVEYAGFVVRNSSPSTVQTSRVSSSDIVFPGYSSYCVMPTYPKHQAACDSGSININQNNKVIDASVQAKYHDIALQNDWKLTIKAGTYCINSLSTNDRGKLYFDLSGGDINILVNKNVRLSNDTDIYYSKDGANWILFDYGSVPDKSQESAGQVFIRKVNDDISLNKEYYQKLYIETLGDFNFNDRIYWFGTIYSAGTIDLSNKLVLVGAYYAHNDSLTGRINNKDNVYAFYLLSNYAAENWK
ncbi:MAG: hypothetical protein AB9872_09545 [Solidesulfovibrio sp.]